MSPDTWALLWSSSLLLVWVLVHAWAWERREVRFETERREWSAERAALLGKAAGVYLGHAAHEALDEVEWSSDEREAEIEAARLKENAAR